jgi:MFS family permease
MTKKLNPIVRRLLPLYLAVFFQSLVLWYAIEKLFMTTIGFDNTLIALMASIYAVTMLIVETPSGLLADRWSRKGVMMIAGLFLAIASLVAGLSTDIWLYLSSAIFWGIFFAFHSGTYDSITYDTLLEETGKADKYEKYYGAMRAVDGLGLVVGSLLGGVVAQFLGMREAYFITVPLALLSIVFLWMLREPQLHKVQEHASMRDQVRSTFGSLLKKGVVIWISLALIIGGLVDQMIFEFDQLWLIALATPIVAYGPVNALLLLTVSIGGIVAAYLSRSKVVTILLAIGLVGLGFALPLAQDTTLVVGAMFLIALLLMAYSIIFNKLLHDRLASNVRAGAMSAISTMSKLLFIPVAMSFGFLSQTTSVFTAAWIVFAFIVAVAVVTVVALSYVRSLPKTMSPTSDEPIK